MLLSQDALDRARKFVEVHGRPLEAARLRFHFDGGPAGAVAAELRKFQNADGGFGHALEPDLRTPASSALATSIAFQIFREVGRDAFGDLADPAVRYLLRTFDPEHMVWRIIPPEAGDSPHAPWWDPARVEETFRAFALNPSAELLGYLFDQRESVPQALLASLSGVILGRLRALEHIEMHDFLCCKRLAETEGLEPAFKAELLGHLGRLLDSTVSRDPAQWQAYGLRPIQVADRPDSPFFDALQDVVPENLDYEIATQQPDGAWLPNWDWGETPFPEAWEQSKQEWICAIATQKLLTLRRYGRIA